MKEQGFFPTVDRYFRRKDTVMARVLQEVCPLEGPQYLESGFKRTLDTTFAVAIALESVPLLTTLALAAKVESGGGGKAFFIHQRIGQERPLGVIKIRSMKEGSDSDAWANQNFARIYGPENDPRTTPLGRLIKKFDLEELPQVWQVAFGQLALVGIRAAAQYAIDYLKDARPQTAGSWQDAYQKGRPGLVSLNYAMSSPRDRKDDARRYHVDMFYAKKASLGLDLYILWRAACRFFSKFI